MKNLDQIDQAYLEKAAIQRSQIAGPDIGDYVLFPTGELERFSHDWGDGIQTSPGGSFYLLANGRAYLSSGGLNPVVPRDTIEEIRGVTLPGCFWFFHHQQAGAGRGIYVESACRVYKTNSPFGGFLGKDLQSPLQNELKAQLEAQLATGLTSSLINPDERQRPKGADARLLSKRKHDLGRSARRYALASHDQDGVVRWSVGGEWNASLLDQSPTLMTGPEVDAFKVRHPNARIVDVIVYREACEVYSAGCNSVLDHRERSTPQTRQAAREAGIKALIRAGFPDDALNIVGLRTN